MAGCFTAPSGRCSFHSKGILRSGETYSEPFEELQIIKPELFDRAQELMTQRTNENRAYRTLPLNTSGQSLLSGNVFCGHCGGRLTLTTNGKVYRKADGTPVKKKRIRYVCYNKTRHRADCDGQTGYTMHILDGIVNEIVKKALDQMGPVEASQITNRLRSHSEMTTRQKMHNAQAALRTAQKEYSSVKAEIIKSFHGESCFSVEVLGELSKDAESKLRNAESHLAKLRFEAALSQDQIEMNQFKDLNWRGLFEQSDMPVKKMVTSYLIQKIYVFRDYAIYIEGNSILSL